MNKILAALIASAFSFGAFAQASAPTDMASGAAMGTGEKASAPMKGGKHHGAAKKHHDTKKHGAASKPAP